eukprot:SAG31_NODE_1617_length_7733_cov_6.446817_7_plen_156_part_00
MRWRRAAAGRRGTATVRCARPREQSCECRVPIEIYSQRSCTNMADQLSELDQLHALGDTKFGRPRGGARARDRRAGAAPAASLVSSHDGSKLSTTTINHGRRAGTPKQSVEPLVLREPSGWGGGSQVGAPPGSISELCESAASFSQWLRFPHTVW